MLRYLINGPILEVKGEGAYVTEEFATVLMAAARDPELLKPTLLLIDIQDSDIVHSFKRGSSSLSLIQQHTMAPFIALVVSSVARDRLAQICRARGEAMGIQIDPDPQSARAWLVHTSSPHR